MSIESIGAIGSSTDIAGTLGTLATGYGQGIADTDNAQMTSSIGGGTGTSYTGSVTGTPSALGISGVGTDTSVDGTSGTDFASLLSGGIDKLQGLLSGATSGLGDRKEQLTDAYGQYVDQGRDYVRQNPGTAVAIAAAAGFILAKILGGGRRDY